jgi:hypothetical protein
MRHAVPSRRHVLQMLAGGLGFAAGIGPGTAGETRIGRLIGEASALPALAQRIDFISRALIGTPYIGYTLVGGPRQAEQFVTRDDGFDCVTFCETVLAAARVFKPSAFEPALRQIRYREGCVEWAERNHYFSDWSEFNIANGICRPVAMPGGETVEKTLEWMPALGPRRMSLVAVPRASLLAHRELLATGDIVGFLSRRPRLDYFHTGFIVVREDGGLWLRHATKSRHRVVDEPLARFMSLNRVARVTLLRPQEPWVEDAVV